MTSAATTGRRAGAIIAAVLIVGYLVVSLLIVIPASNPIRDAVARATSPLLSQRWSMFAPHPLREIFQLDIRAEWRGSEGPLESSDWIPVSEIERREVTGNILPSRVQEATWNAVSLSYLDRYYRLDQEQRAYALEPWFTEAEDGVWHPTADDALVSHFGELGAQGAGVDFIRSDYNMMRFSTLFATAYLGEDIERIQWRVRYLKPNDFAHRFDAEQQFDDRVILFGLRDANVPIEPDVVRAFRDVIDRRGGSR